MQKRSSLPVLLAILFLSLCSVHLFASGILKSVFADQIATDSTSEKMLISQRTSGGWPKQINEKAYNYDNLWSQEFINAIKAGTAHNDATIDNHATSREIRHLVQAFQKTKNEKYLKAAETGIAYLLKMQYQNGGFPQYFPDTSGYRKHITYNDNAMINVLWILRDVSESRPGYDVINTNLKKQSALAVERGISCILKTQIKVDGKLTVWCAQHDHVTYLPAKARAYELPSFSGSESVEIVRFLMEIKNPSAEIRASVNGAVDWLNKATIIGFNTKRIKDPSMPKGQDVVLVAEPDSKIWARFYDLQTGKPFFCGRDGIKKENLKDIENERRTGYAYYGIWPQKLLTKEFPAWLSAQNQKK